MTFKKAEMAKTLKNGLSMNETNPLNHNWSHFMILSGLTLHQFQKKLLLSVKSSNILHPGQEEKEINLLKYEANFLGGGHSDELATVFYINCLEHVCQNIQF